MDSRQLRRYASSSSGIGGFGNFGGAFLLLNALSSRIYHLIEDSTNTIVAGYEQGGVLGLIQSADFRALLRRYLWLLSVAFAFERLRKLWNFLNVISSVTQYLYIDATLKPGDQAYEWILAYWEHSDAFKNRSRDFLVETGPKSKRKQAAAAARYGGEMSIYGNGGSSESKSDEDVVTRISPRENSEQYIWHKGTLFRFRRWLQTSSSNNWGNGPVEQSMISVRSYAVRRQPLFSLLEQAKKVFEQTRPQMVTIRVLDQQRGTWRRVAYRHRRPLASIILEPAKKDELLNDTKEFLTAETWYNQRGIPWKRGYMLTGPPGTGKSSTIQAIASEVKLDVYVLSINSPTMNDGVLQAAFRSIPPKSIVVIEDVDALNVQKRNLDASKQQAMMPGRMMRSGMMAQPIMLPMGSQISLSALLNCIDGIEGNEGRILFMTTNALSTLDPALIRAGRVDIFIEYKKATTDQAEELFCVFYTPAQTSFSEDILETNAAASSTDESRTRPIQPFELPPEITQDDIEDWARQWAAHIPEHEFSIAELQGMLLSWKKDPRGAVEAIATWVVKEQKAKQEAEEARAKKEKEEADTAESDEKKKGKDEESDKGKAENKDKEKKDEAKIKAKREAQRESVDLVNSFGKENLLDLYKQIAAGRGGPATIGTPRGSIQPANGSPTGSDTPSFENVEAVTASSVSAVGKTQ